jgi:phosphoesterase RecJ-like protein
LRWIKDSDKIIIFDKDNFEHQKCFNNADIIFAVDYNELKRVGNLADFIDKSPAYKIMIDHHLQPHDFCSLTISDIKTSSASELMYYFLKQINPDFLNKDIAEAVMTGIIMDTGIFSFNSSNPETFITVSELLTLGAEKEKIIHLLYNTSSENRLRMLGYVINKKMQVNHNKHTAYTSLTKDELHKFNHKIGDTEGFVNLPLSINGIIFSVFFMESDNYIKVSLRSQGDFDVNLFARKYYKGGGHRNASGGKSFKSMSKTIAEFEENLNNYEF